MFADNSDERRSQGPVVRDGDRRTMFSRVMFTDIIGSTAWRQRPATNGGRKLSSTESQHWFVRAVKDQAP